MWFSLLTCTQGSACRRVIQTPRKVRQSKASAGRWEPPAQRAQALVCNLVPLRSGREVMMEVLILVVSIKTAEIGEDSFRSSDDLPKLYVLCIDGRDDRKAARAPP